MSYTHLTTIAGDLDLPWSEAETEIFANEARTRFLAVRWDKPHGQTQTHRADPGQLSQWFHGGFGAAAACYCASSWTREALRARARRIEHSEAPFWEDEGAELAAEWRRWLAGIAQALRDERAEARTD
jgi:hypothetical protein